MDDIKGAVTVYKLWDDQPIGPPPANSSITMDFPPDSKAYVSFRISLSHDNASFLSPKDPLRLNGRKIDIPNFTDDKEELNEFEAELIDVSDFIRPKNEDRKRAQARIKVNYSLGPRATIKSRLPNWEIGRLTLNIVVIPRKESNRNSSLEVNSEINKKYCMFCGKSIQRVFAYCPYEGQFLMSGGIKPKHCMNCGEPIPENAKFCERHGHPQS